MQGIHGIHLADHVLAIREAAEAIMEQQFVTGDGVPVNTIVVVQKNLDGRTIPAFPFVWGVYVYEQEALHRSIDLGEVYRTYTPRTGWLTHKETDIAITGNSQAYATAVEYALERGGLQDKDMNQRVLQRLDREILAENLSSMRWIIENDVLKLNRNLDNDKCRDQALAAIAGGVCTAEKLALEWGWSEQSQQSAMVYLATRVR